MKGYCESCAKRDTCKKDIGIIFGFCKTDYINDSKITLAVPSTEENRKEKKLPQCNNTETEKNKGV